MIADQIAIICEPGRVEALLGFTFGTRPLVFFAPKGGNGHFMDAFGSVQAAFRDRSCCVDGRALFSGGSSGQKLGFDGIWWAHVPHLGLFSKLLPLVCDKDHVGSKCFPSTKLHPVD